MKTYRNNLNIIINIKTMNSRVFLNIIISLSLYSCGKPKNKNFNNFYIISKNDIIEGSKIKSCDPNEPPPPPRGFYSRFNLILDSDTQLYYYYTVRYCKLAEGISDEMPAFIDLRPENLVTIKKEYITTFLKDNIKDGGKREFLMIASNKDTITDPILDSIFNIMKSTRQGISYFIRKMTEEEIYVLNAKTKNIRYNNFNIKWKTEFINRERK